MSSFGENLKRIRIEKNFTQQNIAEHLFVTRQTVSRWECGTRYPDLLTAKNLAQYLNVTIDELLDDEDIRNYKIHNYNKQRKKTVILFSIYAMLIVISLIYILLYKIKLWEYAERYYDIRYRLVYLKLALPALWTSCTGIVTMLFIKLMSIKISDLMAVLFKIIGLALLGLYAVIIIISYVIYNPFIMMLSIKGNVILAFSGIFLSLGISRNISKLRNSAM